MQPRSVLAGASAIVLAGAGLAHAAALEQTVPSTVRLLYQDGMYAEFGLVFTDPDQTGHGATLPPPIGAPTFIPGSTGDLFGSHWNVNAAFKGEINDRFSYVIAFDQPYIADTKYGPGTFPAAVFTYQGSLADVKTYQITGTLAYDVNDSIKLFGGLRAQRLDAKAAIPFLAGYSVDAEKNWSYGYLVGAAYQRPDIALRIALSYYSKIHHDLDTRETSALTGTQDTSTDVDTPQSVLLEAQTGIAPGTLVFGSVHWVDWSQFNIEPPVYGAITSAILGAPRPLVDYADDWWTYNLGLAHQFTDSLAASFSITYEPDVGGVLTTLGPYDGRTTGTLALSYDVGKVNVTGGLTYGKLGDTTNLLDTDFDDGSVWGAGVRVGYTF